jgi:hypothetical protein
MNFDRDPIRATRAARRSRSAWIRGGVALAVALVALLLVLVVVLNRDGRGGDDADTSPVLSRASSPTLAFSVTGAPHALMAAIGASTPQRQAAVIPIPPELTFVMPGQGETVVDELRALPASSVQVGMSNMLGAWMTHVAVMDLDGLAAVVDRAGGITVRVPEGITLRSGGNLDAGDQTLSGKQVRALLAAPGDDEQLRWEIVLEGLLAEPPALKPRDFVETDDAVGAAATWGAASSPRTVSIPTMVVAGTVELAQEPALDQLVSGAFGTPVPVPVVVQNGNGKPGVGEEVARRLIPAGFRVALSQNAQRFNVVRTDILANGTENRADAGKVRRALGVGRVRASQVPSGIGDVTIVVGKDFPG